MSTFDMEVFAKRAASIAEGVRPAVREAQARIGLEAIKASRGFLQRDIYDKPEDVRPGSGQKKWTRSGRLMQNEHIDIRPDDSVTLTNATPYAEPRHEANKPGRRQINPNRTAHWRDETLALIRPRQLEVYRDAILSLLRLGGG